MPPDLFLCSGIVTDGGPRWEPTSILESYESLVWTKRYSAAGDFTLKVPYNSLMSPGPGASTKYIMFNGDIMQIETIDSGTENKDSMLVTITGRDFNKVLMDRDARKNSTVLATPNISSTTTAAQFATNIVNTYCVNAGSEPIDPGFSVVNSAAGNPTADNTTRQMSVAQGTVYDMVKAICDAYKLGFKIVPTGGVLTMYIYSGLDNTTPNQINTFPELLMSPNAETLVSTSYIESVANFRNHARVLGNKAGVDVYLGGVATTGLDLRTVVLMHSEVGPDSSTTVAADQAVLTQLGQAYLANQANGYTYLVDGSINPTGQQLPALGDLVLVQGVTGRSDTQRVTELVYTSDNTGFLVNPTFATP